MKAGDYIILAFVALALAAAIIYIVRCKKKGRCVGCSGSCSGCAMAAQCKKK